MDREKSEVPRVRVRNAKFLSKAVFEGITCGGSLVLKIGRLGADREETAAILSKSVKKIGDPIFVRLARLDGA
ncbi:predicted protein [Arabidopsis lyrata subsp. lyrata]|uniref:Predicted protein n=1 Tax=Arabidopsis lyrata subsp. lyrata TaxID=81972 RepID=D7KIB4_ARALL|nr:predicted protein [Arabidopsis lyrata subsp. lyrata]